MPIKKYLLALTVLTSLAACKKSEAPAQLGLGMPAPEFALADLAGKTYSLANYRGKVVLVNFWATWCPSCREELPALNELYRKHSAEGFVLLGASVDDDGRKALMPFLAAYNLDYPVLLCDPKTAERYQIFGLPASFLIDAQGRLAQTYVGPLTISAIENDILKELRRSKL